MRFLACFVLLLTALPAHAETKDGPFAAVFVDSRTESSRLGAFPYDRGVYAQAIRKIDEAGGRAVVLKYFLDQAKPGVGDAELVRAMGSIPTLVQLSVAAEEPAPNPLDERFYAQGISTDAAAAVEGSEGWLPLPAIALASAGVGAVDIADETKPGRVPLVARYRGRPVKSLWLLAVEQALGAASRLESGRWVAFHGRSVPVTPLNEVEVMLPVDGPIEALPLIDLLDGKINKARLRDKVVVLGYVGAKAGTFEVDGRTVSAHEAFYLALLGLHRRLAP